MRRSVLACLALSLSVAAVASLNYARADAGMRCGTRLVGQGDSTYHVRQVCGDPVEMRQRSELRTIATRARHPVNGRIILAERTVEVAIDEWVYDFGPHKFTRHLTFVQGRLARVETGRYGSSR